MNKYFMTEPVANKLITIAIELASSLTSKLNYYYYYYYYYYY